MRPIIIVMCNIQVIPSLYMSNNEKKFICDSIIPNHDT